VSEDAGALFREEALEHHARPQDLAELLRFPRVWTRWSYWACAALALFAAGYLALARLESYAAVSAVADVRLQDPGACMGDGQASPGPAVTVLLLPAWLRDRVTPGAPVWVQVTGVDQAPTRQSVAAVGARLLDHQAAQRCLAAAIPAAAEAPFLLATAIPGPSDRGADRGRWQVSGLPAQARIRLEVRPLWRLLVSGEEEGQGQRQDGQDPGR
jgi:hypothetical protein